MVRPPGPVLVIGATAQQGGAVARELLGRGRAVRALVRDAGAAGARSLRAAGATLVPGGQGDPASLRAAMSNVDGVFLVLTMMSGPRVSLAGVAAEVRRGQVVSLALRPDVRLQLIAARDIAVFAAIALDHPERFIGQQLEVAGEDLTGPRIAETFGRAAGRPARFQQVPAEQLRAFDTELAAMFEWFNNRAVDAPDFAALRAIHPGLMTLETWLLKTGWKPASPNGEPTHSEET